MKSERDREALRRRFEDSFISDWTWGHWYLGAETEMLGQVFKKGGAINVASVIRPVPDDDNDISGSKIEEAVEIVDKPTGKIIYYFPVSEMKRLGKKQTLEIVARDMEMIGSYFTNTIAFDEIRTVLLKIIGSVLNRP